MIGLVGVLAEQHLVSRFWFLALDKPEVCCHLVFAHFIDYFFLLFQRTSPTLQSLVCWEEDYDVILCNICTQVAGCSRS